MKRNRVLQTTHLKKAFLDAFKQAGNIALACRMTGTPRIDVYRWKEKDQDFAAAFSDAEMEAVEHLEAEALRRAVHGVQRLKFGASGKPVIDPETGEPYRELDYSDTLLIFLLKARDPKKYARNQLELSGEVTTGLILLPQREAIER